MTGILFRNKGNSQRRRGSAMNLDVGRRGYVTLSEYEVTGISFKEREGCKECKLPAFVEST
jgi:hypothetical protein